MGLASALGIVRPEGAWPIGLVMLGLSEPGLVVLVRELVVTPDGANSGGARLDVVCA